jgi:hypothetical protein
MRGIQHDTVARTLGKQLHTTIQTVHYCSGIYYYLSPPTLKLHTSEGLDIALERNKEICQILISTLAVLKSTPYPEIGVERLKRRIILHANSLPSFLTIRVIPITN